MKHLRLVFALCLCLLWGCMEPPFWAYYDAESFVVGYVDCEGWRDTSDNPHNMSLGLKYDNHLSLRHNDDVTYYKYDSKGEAKEKYEELCIKNGDTSYNKEDRLRPEWDNTSGKYTSYVYVQNFVAIDVVSNRDFDENHPAGTSLADIVKYSCHSYWGFVSGGYKDFDSTYYLSGYLNEMPEEGLRLITVSWPIILQFPPIPPTAEGVHTLTVTLTTDEGEIITVKTKRVWKPEVEE